MVIINIDPLDYKYDIETLVRAFFPKTVILVNKDYDKDSDIKAHVEVVFNNDGIFISVDNEKVNINTDLSDRVNTKNVLKRELYYLLSKKCNKTLPWGTLTGIRPVKIALKMLEDGMSCDKIAEFYEKEYLTSKEKVDLTLGIAKKEANILNTFPYRDGYSLYVGIPFCPSRCAYCSFASNDINADFQYVDDYLVALKKEISYIAETFSELKLYTIYVGGGTPTALPCDKLEELLKFINKSFNLNNLKEYTVEAGRPDTVTREKLMVLKKAGVNRISINPQTMNDNTLKIIGRNHTSKDVIIAMNLARSVGFNNINMDFIIGLPNENIEDVRHSMEEALKLKPESLTIHSLAIKRSSKFNIENENYKKLDFNFDTSIMDLTSKYAREMGLKPYYLYRQKNIAGNLENIGYAKLGFEGIYNILIMEEKHIIAASGAGTDTKFVRYDESGRELDVNRIDNVKNLHEYINRIDEMIDRKRNFIKENYHIINIDDKKINEDMKENIFHGIMVSNLAGMLAKEMNLPENEIYDIRLAGLVHDIGKLRLAEYLYGKDRTSLSIEKIRHIRDHSKLGYDILNEYEYSDYVKDCVLHHHENYDGSGVPGHLKGEEIPISARILRVCDVFSALVSNRSYRDAFDIDTAISLLINEVKNFDMNVFLTFQKMINRKNVRNKVIELLEYQNHYN